ncbi:MAG: hypothetical protein DRJ42_23635 [Deltaproteobacteria bacterium]|nr:MAG: hypothetical protein DRJ42_23635 [Deltaproteobacteria bacterium]
MLPPFIIDQIRRREEEERREEAGKQPRLDLPIPMPNLPPPAGEGAEEDADRGLVIIDLRG